MKTIVQQQLGSNGEVSVSAGVKGENIRVEAALAYEKPISEVVDPIVAVTDKWVDKLEELIPGDQKAMAEAAKKEIREAAVDAFKKLGQAPA